MENEINFGTNNEISFYVYEDKIYLCSELQGMSENIEFDVELKDKDIDKIIDFLEGNRKCNNCEWLHKAQYGNICVNERNKVANDYGSEDIEFNFLVGLDFGCKNWQLKKPFIPYE